MQNECTMRTLTIRNVPDEFYEQLKAEAARNHRSLNQEALLKLLRPSNNDEVESADEIIARMRAFRARLPRRYDATIEQIDEWKRQGRE